MTSHSAYLFDLDGTLVVTDPLHMDLWKTILQSYGYELTEHDYHCRIRGKNDQAIWTEFGVGTESERLQWNRWKETEFEKRVNETLPVEGVNAFLDKITDEKYVNYALDHMVWIGVVTNSNGKMANLLLSRLGITNKVDVLITADNCPNPKPSPAPYLMALEELGVDATATVIFEDSPIGIQSALAVHPQKLYVIGTENQVIEPDGGTMTVTFIKNYTLLP